MPVVRVVKSGNGTVFPEDVVSAEAGTDVSVGLHPSQGFKIGTVLVDGAPVKSSPLLRFPSICSDHCVEVSFVKTCVGRTLDYTLSNTSSGITVRGSFRSSNTLTGEASLVLALFNPSNHVSLSFSADGVCAANFSTDDLPCAKRSTGGAQSSAPAPDMSSFAMHIQGSSASVVVLSPGGDTILSSSFNLFSGDGALLEHGWVVAVDGSTAEGHKYPLDLQDLVIEADEKSPILAIRQGSVAPLSQHSRRYVGTL